MSKVGKIARLPERIREELNCRISDNEFGSRLIRWLNSLPEVQAILARDFGGRPINAVNLHKWKAFGYREWDFRRELLLAAMHDARAKRADLVPPPRVKKQTKIKPIKPIFNLS